MDHDAAKGFYITANDEEVLCPVGYKCPGSDAGKVPCVNNAVLYCPEEGMKKEELCPGGKTCEWDASTSSYIVEDCPDNKVRNLGMPFCKSCPNMHIPDNNNSICVIDIEAIKASMNR